METTLCGDLLEVREYILLDGEESIISYQPSQGKTFTYANASHDRLSVTRTPLTLEATIQLPKSVTGRGGVILGNYESVKDNQLNLEIYIEGKVRLYYINDNRYESCIFDPDVRSDEPVHIAVTADGTQAKLYIDGTLADTKPLSLAMPEQVEGLKIGSDNRAGNPQYFKGTVYAVNLFGTVRSSEQILRDAVFVFPDESDLLYTKVYSVGQQGTLGNLPSSGKSFDQSNTVAVETVNLTVPHTIEASVLLPKDLSGRGGVIVGNYDNGIQDQLSLEVHENGKVRLFYISRYQRFDHLFDTDIRTGELVHLALTVDGDTATLYVDGRQTQQVKLTIPFPTKLSSLRIGGDNRADNSQFFKGQIAGVHLFSDVRTEGEIAGDMNFVAGITQGLLASYYFMGNETVNNIAQPLGQSFTPDSKVAAEDRNNAAPATMEALICLPQGYNGRGGVIVGNYGNDSPDQMNLEVYTQGRIRLFLMRGWIRTEHIFNTDIRSDRPVHVAVTLQGKEAILYVDGVETERATLTASAPAVLSDVRIGGDNRIGNPQYFKGTIYSVSLFSDVRTAEEIRMDTTRQDTQDANVILSSLFLPNSSPRSEGTQFTHETALTVPALQNTPATVEAWLRVPLSQNDRAGVLFGNYDNGSEDQLNIEIYNGGKVRLFYITMVSVGIISSLPTSVPVRWYIWLLLWRAIRQPCIWMANLWKQLF